MRETITVNQDVLAARRAAADRFRTRMGDCGTLVVQLLSSPGAGKTTLLEATAQRLSQRWKVAILVGDLATDRDAQRLAPYAPTVQITTGGTCHLELPLIENAYAQLPPDRYDFLFVEDVGNLVCPASHDVGQHLRVIVQSVTEGDDKAGKYPKAFRTAQALVISKIDLLPHVPFMVDAAIEDAQAIQPHLEVFSVCALDHKGIAPWCRYLEKQREQMLHPVHAQPMTSAASHS